MDLTRVRHALVTGGASGIGLGIVNALRERGINITVVDIARDALDRRFGEQREDLLPIELDIRDRAGWTRAKAECETRFGPVDLLFNNAGIGADYKHVTDMSSENFERIVAINLVGVFNGVSTFAADMRARGFGYIVNTASVMGFIHGMPRSGGYCATKGAVISLTETLRSELEGTGVGAAVVCPGPVESNLPNTTRMLGSEAPDDFKPAGTRIMPGIKAGRLILRAIELDLEYILTHPNTFAAAEDRLERMRTSARIAEAEWPKLAGWNDPEPVNR